MIEEPKISLPLELAEKVLLFLGKSTEDALMTFVEDGSTHQELIDLAHKLKGQYEQPELLLQPTTDSVAEKARRARDLLSEVLNCGIEINDERMSYVVMQIDRELFKDIQSFTAGPGD